MPTGLFDTERADALAAEISLAKEDGSVLLAVHRPTWQDDRAADWLVALRENGSAYRSKTRLPEAHVSSPPDRAWFFHVPLLSDMPPLDETNAALAAMRQTGALSSSDAAEDLRDAGTSLRVERVDGVAAAAADADLQAAGQALGVCPQQLTSFLASKQLEREKALYRVVVERAHTFSLADVLAAAHYDTEGRGGLASDGLRSVGKDVLSLLGQLCPRTKMVASGQRAILTTALHPSQLVFCPKLAPDPDDPAAWVLQGHSASVAGLDDSYAAGEVHLVFSCDASHGKTHLLDVDAARLDAEQQESLSRGAKLLHCAALLAHAQAAFPAFPTFSALCDDAVTATGGEDLACVATALSSCAGSQPLRTLLEEAAASSAPLSLRSLAVKVGRHLQQGEGACSAKAHLPLASPCGSFAASVAMEVHKAKATRRQGLGSLTR